MADKTIQIEAPQAVFYGNGRLTLKAKCGGTWSAEEIKSLAWSIGNADGSVFEAAGSGPELSLPLARKNVRRKWGYGCRVRVSFSPTLHATHGLAVIGMGGTPYAPLAAPIASGAVKVHELPDSKRKRSIATLGKTSFSIGLHQSYDGRLGLGLIDYSEGPHFSANAFWPLFGPWAAVVEATTRVEGAQSFVAVNTYDSARITFGLVQFAAHFYDANLVPLLRRWLARKDAAFYFPYLSLKKVDGKDRIHDASGKLLDTKTDPNNTALLDLLNPDGKLVDQNEELLMAGLVHLTRHDPQTCVDQVAQAIRNFRSYLEDMKGKGIHGRPDYIAVVICDIRNQGRASLDDIEKCLKDAQGKPIPDDKAYKALLKLKGKKAKFATRVEELKEAVRKMRDQGLLGRFLYDENSAEFVAPRTGGPA